MVEVLGSQTGRQTHSEIYHYFYSFCNTQTSSQRPLITSNTERKEREREYEFFH